MNYIHKKIEFDYYYKYKMFSNLHKYFYEPSYYFFMDLRKLFALNDIIPGIYGYQKNHLKLYTLHNILEEQINKKLKEIDTIYFEKLFLSLISYKCNEKNIIYYIMYNFDNDNTIYNDYFIRANNNYIEINVLQHILEKKILFKEGKIKPNYNIVREIIYLSKMIYNIEKVLEAIRYKNNFFYIYIDNNYKLILKSIISNNNYKYYNESYEPDTRIINKEIQDIFLKAFKIDLGFDINNFIEISSCLTIDIPQKYTSHLKSNTYIINKFKLVNYIQKLAEIDIPKKEIIKVLNYLTIDFKQMKVEREKSNRYDDKEKIVNTLSEKPIINNNNILYYSPALLSEVHKHFVYSVYTCRFPYNINTPNIEKVMKSIKKSREKLLVVDVAKKVNNYVSGKTYIEKKLHNINTRINKMESEGVGDYDILIIDEINKIIYNIEVKDLKLFSTIYEMSRQYYNFYHKHKYEKKFERRIDFLKKELLNITNIFDYKKYSIVNVIVTNKYFLPLLSENNDIIYLSYGMIDDFFKFRELNLDLKEVKKQINNNIFILH